MKIENKLVKLGFNPRYKGFEYLIDCINYIKESRNYNAKLIDDIYCFVIKKYDITISSIERCIRTLREKCTNKKYRDMVNSEMIKLLAVTI